MKKIICLLALCTLFSGCKTTYDAHRTSPKELQKEGSIVFVRPDKYKILGTRSIRDYIEITYEELKTNSAGFPVLEIGIRNRGGQHFFDTKGDDVQLSVQTAFYDQPTKSEGAASGPAIYRTNWQVVKLVRGQTTDYKVSCPVKNANHYQVTISEFLK